jgi:hypothetical protein
VSNDKRKKFLVGMVMDCNTDLGLKWQYTILLAYTAEQDHSDAHPE